MEAEGMDLVVTSGGLGPTADDLTAEVVARFAGRELVLDESMEEKIARILRDFARRLRLDEDALQAANRKQAMVPEGAIALDPVEIAEAGWFTRAEVQQAADWVDAGADPEPGVRIQGVSPKLSISRYLIDLWLAGELPG
jgi:molybdopterin-biosynthesis enzyme MoeA-like protein